MEKINLVEILKNCPKGTELYSPLCGDCKLYDITDYTIRIETPNKDTLISLYHDGRYCTGGEIMIFPKGKTTWEGFVPPCKFKDGDIIFTHANCLKVGVGNSWISIFKEKRNGGVATYVDYAENGSDYYSDLDGDKALLCMESDILRQRFATEEEKQKLFDAIKANGYKWNTETKTLEKLVKPKFELGDIIRIKGTSAIYVVTEIREDCYMLDDKDIYLTFKTQDDWELVPNKFDITTLKPFDKVLVRGDIRQKWTINFFGFIDNYKKFPFECLGSSVTQCIPYEGNEHLLGTRNKCNEYYKNWK